MIPNLRVTGSFSSVRGAECFKGVDVAVDCVVVWFTSARSKCTSEQNAFRSDPEETDLCSRTSSAAARPDREVTFMRALTTDHITFFG